MNFPLFACAIGIATAPAPSSSSYVESAIARKCIKKFIPSFPLNQTSAQSFAASNGDLALSTYAVAQETQALWEKLGPPTDHAMTCVDAAATSRTNRIEIGRDVIAFLYGLDDNEVVDTRGMSIVTLSPKVTRRGWEVVERGKRVRPRIEVFIDLSMLEDD